MESLQFSRVLIVKTHRFEKKQRVQDNKEMKTHLFYPKLPIMEDQGTMLE